MAKYIDKIEFHNLLKEYKGYEDGIKHCEQIKKNVDDKFTTEEILDAEKNIRVFKAKQKKPYNEIGKRFLLIAQNYINKPRYINYTESWKDDLVSEAVYDMVRYIHNYDVERMDSRHESAKIIPDPFSYFSQYCENGMTRYLKDRYKDMNIMVKLPFIENMDKREVSYE